MGRNRRRIGWCGGRFAWVRRGVTVAAAAPLLVLLTGSAAWAGGRRLGQTPSALSWIQLRDTHGVSVWCYEMSIDRGGVTSPGKLIWSYQIDFFWQVYRSGVVVAIWLIDWVLSFDWLARLATPALAMSGNLHAMVGRFGLGPVLLTAAATAAVVWMARGKWALGIVELFTSLLIASLAMGMLANPVGSVVGNRGVIMQSRDFGMRVAGVLAADGSRVLDADQLRAHTTGMLVDTFIRMPSQLLNFGQVLDGGKCAKPYDAAVRAGPYGTGSAIRDAVGRCDPALGAVAANPGSGQAISGLIISPAALFVLLFAILLAGSVFLAAVYALYQALRAVVTLVTGLLPGPARGSLWLTLADLVMALLTLVFAVVFLTGYLLVIQSVFAGSTPGAGGVMPTFFFVDILLIAGIVLFWRGRKGLRRAGDRLARALSAATRPGGGASSLPARRPFDPSGVYYRTRMAGVLTGRSVDAARAVGGTVAGGRDRLWAEAGTAAGTAARMAGAGVRGVAGRFFAQTALAVATGGGSTVTSAATAATAARSAGAAADAGRAASRALVLGRLAASRPVSTGPANPARSRPSRVEGAGQPGPPGWERVRHGGQAAYIPPRRPDGPPSNTGDGSAAPADTPPRRPTVPRPSRAGVVPSRRSMADRPRGGAAARRDPTGAARLVETLEARRARATGLPPRPPRPDR